MRDRHVTDFGGISIEIDTREIEKLVRAISEIDIDKQDRVMVRALNKGADRLFTRTKRMLGEITGIKKKRRITQGMKKRKAHGSNWQAGLRISDTHTRVTKEYYGARWSRKMPGVQHSAWNRSQMAEGAFMIPGRQPAFIRTSSKRFPIRPLWGPNMAREVERNADVVEAMMNGVVQTYVVPEAYRQIDLEVKRVKNKHGL